MNPFKTAESQSLPYDALLDWYRINHRVLPWRATRDPYRIWISEIILQQTRVAQGLDYFNRFTDRFPDIISLANASDDEVMKLWQGLGYYSRARNLHETARTIRDRYNGAFPTDYTAVRALKGIGDYTAAAIVSFAWNQPYAVVDGNVYRVLSRLFAIDTPIDTTQGKRLFAELAQELLYRSEPGLYNQAIMELGALQCLPQHPECATCPLADHCEALRLKKADELPVKQKHITTTTRYLHYFYFLYKGETWIHKRTGRDIWKGLYEFPLIETSEPTEWPELVKSETFRKWMGIQSSTLTIEASVADLKHVLSHQVLHAALYRIRLSDPVALSDYFLPVRTEELDSFAFARLTERLLEETHTDI